MSRRKGGPRATCPTCGRDVASSVEREGFVSLWRHHAPDGEPCPTVRVRVEA